MKLFLDDGNEDIGGYGAPDLGLHRILAGAEELLDSQMLLDPFEEQFDLPAALVQSGDSQRWQGRVVGQEYEGLARLWIFEANAPQLLGVVLGHVESIEGDTFIAHHTGSSVGRAGVHASGIHAALGSRDEESPDLMQFVQPSEVEIATIHDVKCACLDGQEVQHIDLVQLAVADVDESRNSAAQVQQRVQFDGGFSRTKRRPLEQAQAQIDGGSVECIHAGIELRYPGFVGVQRSCASNQSLSQGMVDAPVAKIQRVGKRRSGRRTLQPHMKQFGLVGGETGFAIAQRLPPGQLQEGHDAKQICATQRTHTRIATVALDDTPEGLPRYELHNLRKQRLAQVHA